MHCLSRVRALSVAIGAMGVCALAQSQQDSLRFIQPTQAQIHGMVDLELSAPADTRTVRFYLDNTQLSELTDAYSLITKTAPVWHTVLSSEWATAGPHTLKVVAVTSHGILSTSMQVRFEKRTGGAISLDGSWRFISADELPVGLMDGDRPRVVDPKFIDSDWPQVVVPNSIDAVDQKWMHGSGLLGTYRRTFTLTQSDLTGADLYLNVESCFWSCRYFVNGKEIGNSVGGYLPRRIRVTSAVQPGNNAIAVVVDSRPSTMGVFKRLRYYYWNYSGLLQNISLQRSARSAVSAVRAQGSADGELTLTPVTDNITGHDVTVPVKIDVLDPKQHTVLHETQNLTILSQGATTAPIHLRLKSAALWDLDHPRLYTIKLTTPDGTVTEKTGFRDIAIVNGDLTLNGKPVLGLQGFDRHADFPGLGKSQPDELADREIKQLHDKGFRIFRPAHYPTTEAELNAADKYGMLVLEEINVTGLNGEELRHPEVIDFAHHQLTRMIARDRSHPSIFAWSIGNENRTDQPGSEVYVKNLISFGKTLDASRPFTEVSAQLRHDICYSYMDFLAVNIYAGWYSDSLTDVVPELDKLATYAGNKPMVITEYGAEAVLGRAGTGKGTEYYQALTVDVHNRLLRNRPHFIGKMYWSSTEFLVGADWTSGNPDPVPPFHTKGLLTYDRRPKLAWRVMFSPIEMGDVPKIEMDPSAPTAKTIHITLHNRESHSVHGMFIVTSPSGYSVSLQQTPFHLEPDGSIELSVEVNVDNASREGQKYGLVRAVVDDQTEAMPELLRITKISSSTKDTDTH